MENTRKTKILNVCFNKIHPGVIHHIKIDIVIVAAHDSAYFNFKAVLKLKLWVFLYRRMGTGHLHYRFFALK